MLWLDPAVRSAARLRLGPREADAFLARLEQLSYDIADPLEHLYGGVTDVPQFVADLVLDALDMAAERPVALRLLGRRREIELSQMGLVSAAPA